MLEKIKAMFAPGPKDRTTAGYLAISLGWTGVHKFYLCRRNVGAIHAALTGVGLIALIAQFTLPTGGAIPIFILAWLALPLGYFYVRRFQLGHPMDEIISPGRLMLWPWRLLRYTFRLTKTGADIMYEDEEERRWRRRERRWGWGRGRRGDDDDDDRYFRRRRGRRRYDDDDDDDEGSKLGCAVVVLGIVLSLAIAAAIVVLYIIVFLFVGFIALIASVAIGVIEGVGYLKKSDEEFQHEYVANQRLWF